MQERESDVSFINTLFQVTLGHEITCLNCKQSHTKFNIEYNLGIDLVGDIRATSFAECLESFFAPERMEASEKVDCEFCGRKTEATK